MHLTIFITVTFNHVECSSSVQVEKKLHWGLGELDNWNSFVSPLEIHSIFLKIILVNGD